MLKKFFLNVLSSLMGAWLAIVLSGIVIVIVIFGSLGGLIAGSQTKSSTLKKGSLLVVDLSGMMDEREANSAPSISDLMSGTGSDVRSLEKYVAALEETADSPDVDAIYLKCNGMAASPATLHALRDALDQCRKNGKRIYAYADMMTQGNYFLATTADSIFVNPQGNLTLQGIGGYTPYFKSLLDKVGVKMQVVKVGTYKSAVEPYILDQMSEPARAQLDTLYNEIWSQYKGAIAKSRKIEPSLIDTLINRDYILSKNASFALKNKLIDGQCYQHQVEEKIASMMGCEKFEEINVVDIDCMYNQYLKNLPTKGKEIAVLYAVGGIAESGNEGILSTDMVPLILELSQDENISAMVLRVNSPGGSAFASEQIWEALEQFKKSGKKLVVSMGDYAASGGYYISCGADKIYADPMTITGSIGIFGLIPDIDGLLTEKLGVNMQLVATNPAGMFPTIVKPMTPEQTDAMQKMVEDGYDIFTRRVAEGRKMPQERVEQIGEGRVWDASKAKKLGLVDELGSLGDAVTCAANLAGCKDYHTKTYPELKPNFWSMLSQMSNTDMASLATSPQLQENMLMMVVRQLLSREPIQARMQDMIIII